MKAFLNIELIKALLPLAWPIVGFIFIILCRHQLRDLLVALTKLTSQITSLKAMGAEVALTPAAATTALPIAQTETKAIEAGTSTNLPALESGASSPTPNSESDTSKDWMFCLLVAESDEDSQKAEELYRKEQEAETDGAQKMRNEARYLWGLFLRGDTSALEKLHTLAQKPGASAPVIRFVGFAYEYAKSFDKAANWFMQSYDKAETQEGRADSLVQAADCLYKAGKHQEAFDAILTRLADFDAELSLSTLYKQLAELYHEAGDERLRVAALEKAVENNPNDTDLLFSAGYALSGLKYSELSLLHYDSALRFNPKQEMAFNNIGVQYAELEMPMNAVAAFKHAATENNTLASANIANRYMQAGFADEAMKVLDEARKQDSVHQNVGSSLAELVRLQKAEEEKRTKVMDAAIEQQLSLRAFADAWFCRVDPKPTLMGEWQTSDGQVVEIAVENNKVRGSWTVSGILTEVHTFTGELSNCGILIDSYKASSDNQYHSPSAYAKYGYAYISSDGKQISILSYKTDGHVRMKLARLTDKTPLLLSA